MEYLWLPPIIICVLENWVWVINLPVVDGVAMQNLLINQVDAEQECAAWCVNQLHSFAREEHRNQSEYHENNYGHEEYAIADGEIPFGLECKER